MAKMCSCYRPIGHKPGIRGFKKNKSNISNGFVFEIFAVWIKIVYPLRGKNSISYRIVLQYFIHYVEFAVGDKVL